jgi:ribose transport system ATP-binding protein
MVHERGTTPSILPPVLTLRGLSKSFGGVRALDDVALLIEAGEVHGLLGENGSGKSTLIKVLNGFHAPDPGARLEVCGAPEELPLAAGRFRDLGLSFVHQDLGLVEDLTVVENLRVSEVIANSGRFVSWSRERRRARELFARYGLDIDPGASLRSLTETERALLAIVRAVEGIRTGREGRDGGLLILDEPTVFLPREGVDRLFAMVREVVSDGRTSVLFVSHDLDEVRDICDRVTVLRDGKLQATVRVADTTHDSLIELILGRELGDMAAEHEPTSGEVAVRVRALTARTLDGVAFDVERGEILGVTGLMGSGFEDIPYALYGARDDVEGSLEAYGRTWDVGHLSPHDSIANGTILIPSDRKKDGSAIELSVADNVLLPVLGEFSGPSGLKRAGLRRRAAELMTEYDVRPAAPEAVYGALSGGNQQKVLLAKWLQLKPKLILLHEPTQGVDVGARAQVFEILQNAAAEGTSVVCASSDLEQLAAICHRVLIFARGRIVAELTGSAITKDHLTQQVLGSVSLRETTMGAVS